MDENINHSYCESGVENPVLSDRLCEGLRYSEEDVESSSSFVLLCHFEIDENGTMIKYTGFDDQDPRTHFIAYLFSNYLYTECLQIPQSIRSPRLQRFSTFIPMTLMDMDNTQNWTGSRSICALATT